METILYIGVCKTGLKVVEKESRELMRAWGYLLMLLEDTRAVVKYDLCKRSEQSGFEAILIMKPW